MVIYDCVMAPITWAYGKSDIFSPKVGFIVDLISYFNSLVFLSDILAGFRKAYLHEKDGVECRDPKKIAERYLKGYFIIDLLSAIPFDMFVNFDGSFAFLILFPLLKILRLYRLKKIITYLQMDNKSRTRIRILYLAIRLIFINHWVACAL